VLFENDPGQLNLFHSEEAEALDIVAELIDQMGHTGAMDDVRRWEQTRRWYLKLVEHPAYKAAEERRRKRYWDHLDRVARRVESWPAWMKGSPTNSR
jgi:hypothetical protein